MRCGWIKLHRKTIESAVFSDAYLFRTWMFLLMSATHEPREKLIGSKLIKMKPGQYTTSARLLGKQLDIDPMTANRHLKMLEKIGCIKREKYGTVCSLITIKKWDDYQSDKPLVLINNTSGNTSDNTSGNTSDNTITRMKECKNERSRSSDLLQHYVQCGFPMNGYAADYVTELEEMYGEVWCREAMTRAAERGKTTIAYLKGILNSWKTSGGMDSMNREEAEQQKRDEAEKKKREERQQRQQQEQTEIDERQKILDEIPELYEIRAEMASLVKQLIGSSAEHRKLLEIERQKLVERKRKLLVAHNYKGDEI